MGDDDSVFQHYIRPFELVESLNLSCGYEKSFKLIDRHLLRNRYLIGIECAQLDRDRLMLIFARIEMPDEFVDAFWQNYDGANLVLIGFEEGVSSWTYRVYLEFWDRIQATVGASPEPARMFLGYKWDAENPSRRAITDYRYFPGLSVDRIRHRIDALEAQSGAADLFSATREIVELSARHAAGQPLVYLEASEAGNPRRSFDINLYPSGLRLQQIRPWVDPLSRQFKIAGGEIERLFASVGPALLGHLSGGVGRDGDGFFSVYYESEPGTAA